MLVTLLAGLMLLGGCEALQRTMHADSVADSLGAVDDELDFQDELAMRRAVTNNDVLHTLLMTAGETNIETPEARIALARDRGWIGPDEELEPNRSASLGLVAMAVCEILDIEAGFLASIVGNSPRACTRELIFRGMIPRRSDNQALSGLELIEITSRCEDFLSIKASGK